MMSGVFRSGLLLGMLGVGGGSLCAQTVELVYVGKSIGHVQTSSTQVDVLPGGEFPFGFDANVSGEDMDLIAAPVVSGPITNPEPGHNGGVLGFNTDDEDWQYGFPDFEDWSAQTKAALDALFANGVYAINVTGTNVTLNLMGDLYAADPPTLTLVGGAWSGGVYEIAPDTELTITTSEFVEYGTHVEDAISLDIAGEGYDQNQTQLASENPSKSLAMVVPAGSLQPGELYYVDAAFIASPDAREGEAGLPDALIVAAFESATELVIQAAAVACSPADLTTTGAGVGDSGFGVPDGEVTATDLQYFVNGWFADDTAIADLTTTGAGEGDPGFGVPDGEVTATDLQYYVNLWFAGCP